MSAQGVFMLCVLPETLSETDGNNRGITDSEREDLSRKKAIRVYLGLSVLQVVCGLVTVVSSSISVHYHSGGGFPYYTGSFVIGCMLLISSMVAFRVYNKGPLFTFCEVSRKEVLCALNMHRGISFLMFFACVIGLAIIWMYGLCLVNDTSCSYSEHFQINKTIAIIVFVLGCVGLITSAIGIALIRKYGEAFGLQIMTRRDRHLRYMGYPGDVRRETIQSIDMQRQINNQNNYPYMHSGCAGFTNYGFEPPTPPPYTPSAVQLTVDGREVQSGQILQSTSPCINPENPPKYSDLEPNVIPSEPPPAYKETEDSKMDSNTTD